MFKNFKLLVPIFLFIFLGASSSINSVSYIHGLPFISIEEVKKLNFGTISTPTSNVTATVRFNNMLTGTAQYIDTSTGSAGEYKVYGSFVNAISIQAEDIGTYTYISFKRMRARYPGSNGAFNLFQGASNLQPPANGSLLKISAQLKVEGNTPQGNYSPAFSISIYYD
jgi:hypothetical protein